MRFPKSSPEKKAKEFAGYGILSIDPGITGTGICRWNSLGWKKFEYPTGIETFSPRRFDDWTYTAEVYHDKLKQLADEYDVKRIYCEFPQYFQSAKGHAATAKGDIHKLAFLIGVFAAVAYEIGSEFTPIYVNTWKGQLPKEEVTRRIIRKLPDIRTRLAPESHEWDAIGIGLFAQGFSFDGC